MPFLLLRPPFSQTKVLAVYGSRDAMRSDYALLEDKLPQSQVHFAKCRNGSSELGGTAERRRPRRW